MQKTKVAILGAGFITNIHMESYHRFVPEAEVVAVYARNAEKAQAFAEKYHIPKWYDELDDIIQNSGCEVVDICLPNFLHFEATLKAAAAGKHIIIEKPLAITIEEADEMIAACKKAGVKLMYAEELCFAPKYERVRQLVNEGAFGDVYMLKQSEKHSGPHTDWFYDINLSGGGVLMDMGCHAFGWFRWMLNNAKVKSVYASMSTVLHKNRTRGEDNSVVIVEFENGVTAIAENSWANMEEWMTAVRYMEQEALFMQIYLWVMLQYLTAKTDTVMQWKKPTQLLAGALLYLKKLSTRDTRMS